MLPARLGSNPQPPDNQLDMHPNEPLRPAANSVEPDHLASEANWSGYALFVIQYVNLNQHPGSSNLIGWQLEVGVAS